MPVVDLLVASAETVAARPRAAARRVRRGVHRRCCAGWTGPGARLVRSAALVVAGCGAAAGGGSFARGQPRPTSIRTRTCGGRPHPTARLDVPGAAVHASTCGHGDGDRAHRRGGRPDHRGRPGDRRPARASTRSTSCAGDVDLVAITHVADHEAIAELVPGHISKVAGRAAHRHPHRVPAVFAAATPTTPSRSACRPDRRSQPRRVRRRPASR